MAPREGLILATVEGAGGHSLNVSRIMAFNIGNCSSSVDLKESISVYLESSLASSLKYSGCFARTYVMYASAVAVVSTP